MRYDYECERCKVIEEQVMSLEEYEFNRIVCCPVCNKPMKRIVSAPVWVGAAKAKNKYDPDDIHNPKWGDRNTFESYRILEKNGKLTKEFIKKSGSGDEIKELAKRKSEFS